MPDDEIDWAERLRAAGIDVSEDDRIEAEAERSNRVIGACILAGPRPGGYSFAVFLHPRLSLEERSETCHEAMKRFDRIFDLGPDPDGWQLRSDGDYQLWLVLRQFDPWLTEHE